MKNRKRFIRYRMRMKKIARHGMTLSMTCPFCGNSAFHYDRYYAECCLLCDIWLSKFCDDSKCPLCSNCPDSPSKAIFYESNRITNPKDWLRRNYQHKHSGKLKHEKRRNYYQKNKSKGL